jgi:hypothetical protein
MHRLFVLFRLFPSFSGALFFGERPEKEINRRGAYDENQHHHSRNEIDLGKSRIWHS